MITLRNNISEHYNFLEGESFLIDKPIRWSSFKVIHEIRKVIGVKKVGHAGTLDPMATGLLILCSGKKTKEISSFQDLKKTYAGKFKLGESTPSMDKETEVTETKEYSHIGETEIFAATKKFTGEIQQLPPMYSAVNYQGKKLYQYIRKGQTVPREPRNVSVYSFKIGKVELPFIEFEIVCSKGTYIRVIADDMGKELNCGAHLFELRRTAIGDFSVDDAFSVQSFRDRFGRKSGE